MKNIYEVLRQKETDLERVREEIEALRCVIPLLTEAGIQPAVSHEMPVSGGQQRNRWPLQVGDSRPAPAGPEPV